MNRWRSGRDKFLPARASQSKRDRSGQRQKLPCAERVEKRGQRQDRFRCCQWLTPSSSLVSSSSIMMTSSSTSPVSSSSSSLSNSALSSDWLGGTTFELGD